MSFIDRLPTLFGVENAKDFADFKSKLARRGPTSITIKPFTVATAPNVYQDITYGVVLEAQTRSRDVKSRIVVRRIVKDVNGQSYIGNRTRAPIVSERQLAENDYRTLATAIEYYDDLSGNFPGTAVQIVTADGVMVDEQLNQERELVKNQQISPWPT